MTKKKWKRFLVKIGSSCWQDAKQVEKICLEVAELSESGHEIILVSSGAIHLGQKILNSGPHNHIHRKQAAAALGQPRLMHMYQDFFAKKNKEVAQVLLTHQDMNRTSSYHNLQSCLESLLSHGIIPIINENDSVSFEEITLGDNDHLAARIAMMLEVDLAIYLTQSDGVLLEDGSYLKRTSDLQEIRKIKRMQKSQSGTGGMQSKLEAIAKIHAVNIPAVIASFHGKSPLFHVLNDSGGSWFECKTTKAKNQHRKIISQAKKGAFVSIDQGAHIALKKNASLLPSGITKVAGNFQRGDCIGIKYGRIIVGYGISEYSAVEVKKIQGLKSTDISTKLGYHVSNVVIHKNYLAMGKKT
tara:strand:+ start:7774 stop:8844 length:1071 start_codon:yes stop_codon:yes gene_type:complete